MDRRLQQPVRGDALDPATVSQHDGAGERTRLTLRSNRRRMRAGGIVL
jgi:hypothetical protein